MKTSDLLVSNLSITEDDYDYRGNFTLSSREIAIRIELSDMDDHFTIERIKETFLLDEDIKEIRKTIMDTVISHSGIDSRNVEGDNYNDSSEDLSIEKAAGTADMA